MTPTPKPRTDWFSVNRPIYERVKGVIRRDFPEVFDGRNPPPLKIGIRADLIAHYFYAIDPNDIEVFLTFWCRRREYQAGMSIAKERVGLDGARYPLDLGHKTIAEKIVGKIDAAKKLKQKQPLQASA